MSFMIEKSDAQRFSGLQPIQYDFSVGSLQLFKHDLEANAPEYDVGANTPEYNKGPEAPKRHNKDSQLPEAGFSLL